MADKKSKEKTIRPLLKKYDVQVTRISTYRVRAANMDDAWEAFFGGEYCNTKPFYVETVGDEIDQVDDDAQINGGHLEPTDVVCPRCDFITGLPCLKDGDKKTITCEGCDNRLDVVHLNGKNMIVEDE